MNDKELAAMVGAFVLRTCADAKFIHVDAITPESIHMTGQAFLEFRKSFLGKMDKLVSIIHQAGIDKLRKEAN